MKGFCDFLLAGGERIVVNVSFIMAIYEREGSCHALTMFDSRPIALAETYSVICSKISEATGDGATFKPTVIPSAPQNQPPRQAQAPQQVPPQPPVQSVPPTVNQQSDKKK